MRRKRANPFPPSFFSCPNDLRRMSTDYGVDNDLQISSRSTRQSILRSRICRCIPSGGHRAWRAQWGQSPWKRHLLVIMTWCQHITPCANVVICCKAKNTNEWASNDSPLPQTLRHGVEIPNTVGPSDDRFSFLNRTTETIYRAFNIGNSTPYV